MDKLTKVASRYGRSSTINFTQMHVDNFSNNTDKSINGNCTFANIMDQMVEGVVNGHVLNVWYGYHRAGVWDD